MLRNHKVFCDESLSWQPKLAENKDGFCFEHILVSFLAQIISQMSRQYCIKKETNNIQSILELEFMISQYC